MKTQSILIGLICAAKLCAEEPMLSLQKTDEITPLGTNLIFRGELHGVGEKADALVVTPMVQKWSADNQCHLIGAAIGNRIEWFKLIERDFDEVGSLKDEKSFVAMLGESDNLVLGSWGLNGKDHIDRVWRRARFKDGIMHIQKIVATFSRQEDSDGPWAVEKVSVHDAICVVSPK